MQANFGRPRSLSVGTVGTGLQQAQVLPHPLVMYQPTEGHTFFLSFQLVLDQHLKLAACTKIPLYVYVFEFLVQITPDV
jgi:hypothetical protein